MSTVTEPRQMSRVESSLDRKAAGEIAISARGGLVIESMGQAMEFAKLMAIAKEAVPKHCRENPGLCLAICIQGYEWRMNPMALAQKSYVVNDRLCYEASMYQSVVARRAPIVGRIKMEFSGDGANRICKVWAELDDASGVVEYVSPKFHAINPKNSPLWKNDPDQQLFYFSVRAFARRHFPDVMMGIYTVDEMLDSVDQVRTVATQDSRSKSDRLADRLISPVSSVGEPPLPEATVQDEAATSEPGSQLYDELMTEIHRSDDNEKLNVATQLVQQAFARERITQEQCDDLLATIQEVRERE